MPFAAPPILVLSLLLALLAGCGRGAAPTEPGAARDAAGSPRSAMDTDSGSHQDAATDAAARGGGYEFEAYAYQCNGLEIAVRPGDGNLTLILPERTLVLPQVESASGARYAEGENGFWGRGINSGLLTLDGEDIPCQLDRRATPWVDAQVRGATFRGIGQEPGWHLEIHPDRLVMTYAYGTERAVAPNPGAVADADPAVRRWDAVTEAHTLAVRVEDRACTDIMSGETFPATVSVTLDGREYRGCGRNLD